MQHRRFQLYHAGRRICHDPDRVPHPRPFSKSRLCEELKPACDRLGMFLAVSPLTMADLRGPGERTGDLPGVGLRCGPAGYRLPGHPRAGLQEINITDLTTKLIRDKNAGHGVS